MTTLNLQVGASSDDAREVSTVVTLTDVSLIMNGTSRWAGFRFTDAPPAGATVDTAVWSPYFNSTSVDDPDCRIYGEDAASSATFTTGASNITGRPRTTATVDWTATGVGAGHQPSPSIVSIIQELVDRGDLTAIAIIINSLSATEYRIRTYDNSTAQGALLDIDYTEGGGTLFTQSAAGTLTSAGAIIKEPHKVVAGTLTSAGSLIKEPHKTLAGALTSSGALTKKALKSLAGTLTSSGALSTLKTSFVALSGTLTSAGTLTKKGLKQLTGTLTTTGALSRLTDKILTGTLTSAGTLTKKTLKVLAGTLTSAGDVTVRIVFVKVLAGTLSMAGTLSRETQKQLSGALTPTGALIKETAKSLTGALSFAGSLTKEAAKDLAGTLTTAGSLTKEAARSLAGTLTSAGSLTKEAHKNLTGTLTSAGSLTRKTLKNLTGTLASAGSLATQLISGVIQQAVGGTLSFAGDVKKKVKNYWPAAYRLPGLSIAGLAKSWPASCLSPGPGLGYSPGHSPAQLS